MFVVLSVIYKILSFIKSVSRYFAVKLHVPNIFSSMTNSTGSATSDVPSVRPKGHGHVKSASLSQSQTSRANDLPPLSDSENYRPT